MISLIINTAAGVSRDIKSSGGVPHDRRGYALRNFILPSYTVSGMFDEIFVVGEWESGEGYEYIHCPSEHFSCVDALQQRQAGFEASNGRTSPKRV